MDSDRLKAFAAVAREGGFTAAARTLGKTQSAISQAVAGLERELGQSLFVREARRVSLTEAGRILLHHAEQAFAELGAAERALAALGELRGGQLRVGSSDTLAYYALPSALSSFRERYPDVELQLVTRPSPATASAVAAREVDVGVVTLPLPPDLEHGDRPIRQALRIVELGPELEVLIVPPDHRLARRKRVGLRALAREPLLLLARGTAGRAAMDAQLARARVEPRVAMEMDSVELLKRLTELGFGVSIVPARSVEREVRSGQLAAVPLSGLQRRSLGLILPARDPIGPAARALAALIEEHAAALAPRGARRLS